MPCPVSYYEGLFPGKGIDMLAVSVSQMSGGGFPTLYRKWQDVQFTVRIRKAEGNWPLVDVLQCISGRKVVVDSDDVEDTVVIVVEQGSGSGVQRTCIYGDLGWPINVPHQSSVQRKCIYLMSPMG